jgi:hypothetical protein
VSFGNYQFFYDARAHKIAKFFLFCVIACIMTSCEIFQIVAILMMMMMNAGYTRLSPPNN